MKNKGDIAEQKLVNSGAIERQGLENIGRYDQQRLKNEGAMAVAGSKAETETNKLNLEKRKFIYTANKDTREFNEDVRQFDVSRGDKNFQFLSKRENGDSGLGVGAGTGDKPGLTDEGIVDRLKLIDTQMNVGAHVGSNKPSEDKAMMTYARSLASQMKGMTEDELKHFDVDPAALPYLQRIVKESGLGGKSSGTNKSVTSSPQKAEDKQASKNRATIKGVPVDGAKAEPKGGWKPPKTSFSRKELDRFKRPERDYKPADNPIEAATGKRFPANPESILTKVQKGSGWSQTGSAQRFGEDTVATALRKQGLSDDKQTLKNMSKRLQKKYPDISPEKLAEMIRKSKSKLANK
ncbi:MAG: hypothetical protein JEZ12_13020 [Desulfobacterium sp.]|nr:hypothetical protein [Desulfobacterium sp.]